LSDRRGWVEHGRGLHPERVAGDQGDLVVPQPAQDLRSLGQSGRVVSRRVAVEAYRRVVGRLLDRGISEADIRTMIADNPARRLGLD
jgi:hypothetical protein